MAHERLAIVDPTSGKQPLLNENKTLILAANGEIYNHRGFENNLKGRYSFQTESDCEVLLALYQEKGASFMDELSGIYAFISTTHKGKYFIARDHMELFHCIWDGMLMNPFMLHLNLKPLRAFVQN